jgi:hypothetical protein
MPETWCSPNPSALEEDALYLGVLTAKDIKPLSQLEYPVSAHILDILSRLGLFTTTITRITRNGNHVPHIILAKDAGLVDRYRADFDGRVLRDEPTRIIRLEARYFGYPACCAEAYIQAPYAPNGLAQEDQALLFHYACPGCCKTPPMIPFYRDALSEARQLYSKLCRSQY